jgi:hypothetical protein
MSFETVRPETLMDIADEVQRARFKFPNNSRLYAAFNEACGEVGRVLCERQEQRAWYNELKQVAAMAIRLMEEGDPAYEETRPAVEQHAV